MRIGRHFTAISTQRHNTIGIIQPVVLKTTKSTAHLIIGDHVGLSGCTISAQNRIVIGGHVMIGSGSIIMDSDAHSLDVDSRRRGEVGVSKPIVIGDDVFIGTRVLVLKGVTIGTGAVIGAGSVVTHDIPAGAVAAGNPAKVIRWADKERK